MLLILTTEQCIREYHKALSQKAGYDGRRLYDYQEDEIYRFAEEIGQHYEDYVHILNCKPPEPTTKAAMERWQKQFNDISSHFGRGMFWAMGSGKLLPDSEPILTPSGWAKNGNLKVGDKVIGQDGLPTEVVAVFPQGVQPIVRVTFSDGSWVRCSWDHLWTVQHVGTDRGTRRIGRRKGHPFRYRVMSTREIMDFGLHDINGNRRWHIPMIKPVEYNPVSLPIEPYLFGVIIGDGSTRSGSNRITITTDKEIIDAIGVNGYHHPNSSNGITDFTITDQQVVSALKILGLHGKRSWEKFIPEDYLHGSPIQRLALLQGLMDTDGTAGRSGGAQFCSTSTALINAVIELTQSLGGTARARRLCKSIYTYNGKKHHGRPAEVVTIKLPSPVIPFRLQRKRERYIIPTKYPVTRLIKSIESDGEESSRCIKVAATDGLYVTRHFVVTHNTAVSIALVHVMYRLFPKLFYDGQQKPIPSLIIARAAPLESTWITEIKRWSPIDPAVDMLLIPSDEREMTLAMLAVEYARPLFCLTTYDTMRCDYSGKRQQNGRLHVPWGIVINDECHETKNHGADRTRALYMLPNRIRVPLGGTPMTKRPNDLHASLVQISGYTSVTEDGTPLRRSEKVGSYDSFLRKYCVMSKGKLLAGQNLTSGTCTLCPYGRCNRCRYRWLSPEIRQKYCMKCTAEIPSACLSCERPLHNFMLGMASRRDTHIEPYQMLPIEPHGLTSIQQQVYDQLKNGYIKFMMLDGQREDALTITNIMTQWHYFRCLSVDLRQVANSIKNFLAKPRDPETMVFLKHLDTRQLMALLSLAARARPDELSGKQNALDNLLENEIDLFDYQNINGEMIPQKMIIFEYFIATAEALAEHYKRYNPVMITGESNQKHLTAEYVRRFQEDDNCRMLIGNFAAKDGLNLQAATHVVVYGHFSWNAEDLNQAIARAHRNGRKGTLQVIKLLAKGFENNLQEMWLSKQIDFDAAMDGKISRAERWLSFSDMLNMV